MENNSSVMLTAIDSSDPELLAPGPAIIQNLDTL